MGHHHKHEHHHHYDQSGNNLLWAFLLNLAFTIFEIIGGLYVNSVAILSDAVHDLGDSLSLGLAWYLNKKSKQAADKNFTFGYSRFSLLGALINSVVLIAGSIFVINEAVKRFINPESSDANGMMVFAIFGVAVNGFAAWKLSGGKTLNEKVITWHLLEDVLGWVAVLVVAIVLKFYDTPYLDPALSLFISAYILWNVVKRLKETLYLFLQGSPEEISVQQVEEKLLEIENIQSVHHTHIWSLDGENHVFTSHVKLKNVPNLNAILQVKKAIKEALKEYNFKTYTIETELEEEACALQDKEEKSLSN